MKRKVLVLLVTGILIFAFAGCGTGNVDNLSSDLGMSLPQNNDISSVVSDASSMLDDVSSVVSDALQSVKADDAKGIALKHAGATKDKISAFKIELDKDDKVPHYEIEFNFGGARYEYDINAKTGAIIKAEKDDKNILSSQNSEFITEAKAKEIALSHAGLSAKDITQYEIELDSDDTVPHYEIDFKSGGYEYEYDINAKNGAVIKSQKEKD